MVSAKGAIVGVYHQMGHDTKNLLHIDELNRFSGAILSPVNDTETGILAQIESLRDREGFETVFDPQLYYPKSERGHLKEWSYFPQGVDTADISSEAFWQEVTERLAEACVRINPHAACSPAFAPVIYHNDYYAMMVRICDFLSEFLRGTGIRPIQTVMAGLADLSVPSRALEIASIVSRTKADFIYLVLVGSTEPRRELNNVEEIKGAMRLISNLEKNDLRVIVGFSSSDFVLWKDAGASICATGKYFNLRRYTSSRFAEPAEGGQQLPYWFEESLLAFLRESDVIRVSNQSALSEASLVNPFALQVLESLNTLPGQAWLALSWRQYMHAFCDLEERIENGTVDISHLLRETERRWLSLEDASVLMEEPRNNGEWIRAWRRALIEYPRH